MRVLAFITSILLAATIAPAPARAADRTFAAGSLIIPMDLAYQARGMFQAYGLLYQLLRQGVRVHWIIDPGKTYHAAPCNTPGDLCPWDCAVDGSGVKCPYPTASPDFAAEATIVWSDAGATPGTPIGRHRYRGGPFVIDAADRTTALAIIEAWNTNQIARPVFQVVTVHEATAGFTGNVAKEMIAAPTIAVFSDGNEDIATGYLRAAGIPQSNGQPFPSAKCGVCGPGTANPDMLTETAIHGELGTCSAPNYDHKNGALWTRDGLPAYCQIMSMHWDVTKREQVTCAGGCGTTCNGQAYTYHGHEVVAEVREFLKYPVHFFAECQAVNAYENTTPNPAYPWLDDPGRDGHFLTTTGTPPPCPCDADYTCVNNVCIPKDVKEQGAGFLIAAQPATSTLKVLRPEVPYNQFDGAFASVGGSEPAYNLSAYLKTTYKNNRQVTLITGPNGPGAQDVWMSGYLDGECDIILLKDGTRKAENCKSGKVSYLGGHQYGTNVPLASPSASMGTRLFLNALFEADCVTTEGQPLLALSLSPALVPAQTFPAEAELTVGFANQTTGFALAAKLVQDVPSSLAVIAAGGGGVIEAPRVTWTVGSISGAPAYPGDPPSSGSYVTKLSFPAAGEYPVTLTLTYRVGTSELTTTQTFTVRAALDTDGDGVPDETDPFPNDPTRCGDQDGDGCDDCDASCDG
ncbi:MAG TPA: hypothetical protein VK932_30030, partial [Kofleriaceae bacterium]|nr:hypothetical protein [Kofleriaceae bacterium]